MTTNDKIVITCELLKKYGNYSIKKRLENKGFHYSKILYRLSFCLAEYRKDMEHIMESDYSWTKRLVKLIKKYQEYQRCCRITLKLMRRPNDGQM